MDNNFNDDLEEKMPPKRVAKKRAASPGGLQATVPPHPRSIVRTSRLVRVRRWFQTSL